MPIPLPRLLPPIMTAMQARRLKAKAVGLAALACSTASSSPSLLLRPLFADLPCHANHGAPLPATATSRAADRRQAGDHDRVLGRRPAVRVRGVAPAESPGLDRGRGGAVRHGVKLTISHGRGGGTVSRGPRHLAVLSQPPDTFQELRFVEYLHAATPETEYGRMGIGSRPSKRRPCGGIESQTRFHLPVWLGLGAAFWHATGSPGRLAEREILAAFRTDEMRAAMSYLDNTI